MKKPNALTLDSDSWKCDSRPFLAASLYERKLNTVAGKNASFLLNEAVSSDSFSSPPVKGRRAAK